MHRNNSVATLLLGFAVVLALFMPLSASAQDDAGDVQDDAAQDEAATGEATEAEEGEAGSEADATADPDAEAAPVPESFDPLLEEFQALVGKVEESGLGPMAQGDDITALLEKVVQFNEAGQPTEQSAAVEIQLVLWNSEFGPKRDAAFARLENLDITSGGLRVLWAQHLKERSYKYERAIEILDQGEIDLSKYPVAAVIRAESLIPQNRFDEAIAALDSIPPGARVRPDLLDRMYFLRQQIDDLKADWSEEAEIRAAEAAADDLPRVSIETSRGTIVVELYENEAPNTVANFINLVEQGFYGGSSFYQVVPNSFIAAGDPAVRADLVTAPDSAGLGYQLPVELPKADEAPPPPVEEEIDPAGAEGEEAAEGEEDAPPLIDLPERSRSHFAGVLSMERAGENIDASRFMIVLRQRPDRDERNVAFGRVIEGMAIAREITGEDRIIAAQVLRKRDHEYDAVTIALPKEPEEPEEPADAAAGEGEASEGGEVLNDESGVDDGAVDDAGDEAGEGTGEAGDDGGVEDEDGDGGGAVDEGGGDRGVVNEGGSAGRGASSGGGGA